MHSADFISPAEPRAAKGTGRRLHGSIAHKLGVAILSGKYAPGDKLSGEVAFAEELNVSRSAYREAVQVLIAKGLVESRPKAGTKVLPRGRWNLLDPEVLAWAFAGEHYTTTKLVGAAVTLGGVAIAQFSGSAAAREVPPVLD